MRFMILLILGMVVVLGGAALGVMYLTRNPSPDYRTDKVQRGDLSPTISAPGTVEPEDLVNVGAQVVGRVDRLGIDPGDPQKKKTIDYRSVVDEGTVLAVIDDAVYKAQRDQANASLTRARADLLQMEAKLVQAERDWERARDLWPSKAIAKSDYDVAVANHKAAQANVEVGKAVIKQSEAALLLAETNLGYTVIRSPVKGEIITRRVNVGQTVVSSLNAPSLFLIAKDLKRMQVWVSVSEADIGRVKEGMPVRFAVDAYPDEIFRGKVYQIRFNANMSQNVVTYTVVVSTDNSNLKLYPYMSANVQFETDHRPNVLKVLNSALRWKPKLQQVVPDAREAAAAILAAKGNRAKPPPDKRGGDAKAASGAGKSPGEAGQVKEIEGIAKERAAKKPAKEDRGFLWKKEGDYVRPIAVQIGLSDGVSTEVSGPDLEENLEVVFGENVTQAGDDSKNLLGPPKFFKGRKKT